MGRKRVFTILLAFLMIGYSLLFLSPEVRAGSMVSHKVIIINKDSDFNATTFTV